MRWGTSCTRSISTRGHKAVPLKEHFPIIDDRRYADIVAEARSRIPRYTPEWTDVNESDPGMTLVELFAWMTEMQIYRLSKVPQLNYLKFLELIGIELEPAKPARAEITFPVQETFGDPYVIVPARTQVATEEPDEQGPIVFETDRALTALKARLDTVQVFDGYTFKDVSQDNNRVDEVYEPFGPLAIEESALYLGFDYENDFPSVAFDLAFQLPDDNHNTVALRCIDAGTGVFVSSSLCWEYWNGKEWRTLNVLKDETRALTTSGYVHLKAPSLGEMVPSVIGKISAARYWIRARIDRADYEQAPTLVTVRSNTVPASQAETIASEVPGGSNGRPDQIVTLSDSPVLNGTLILQVDEGRGFETWTEVDDFFGSTRDDPHYVLNRTTGEIHFGSGAQRIPVANPNRTANFLALEYRVGGGTRGNVPANSITALIDVVEGIDSNGVQNLFASYGGADEETIEEAKTRAPIALKSRNRAVTAEDFELLTLRAANIARAKALPLFHPEFPGVEVPGVVTVIVVPDIVDENNDPHPAPMPSEGTLKTVCAYLNERRLLTAELYVIKPRYMEIRITAELVAQESADLAEIKVNTNKLINKYFHPLIGGEQSSLEGNGPGWPFGGDIYYSLVFSRLMSEGVKRVASLTIELDGDQYPHCQDVPVPNGVLLTNSAHDIQVQYDFGAQG